MTLIEKQILDLLQDGKSYREIQRELQVSPSKISTVKNKYLPELEDTNDTPNIDGSIGSGSSSSSGSSSASLESLIGQLPKNQQETTPQPYRSSNTEALLQIRKLELEHERMMKEMEIEERDKEREFELNKMEHKNSITENVVKDLKQKIESLEEQIQEIEEENTIDDSNYEDELDDELDNDGNLTPDELYEKYKEYITGFIAWDEDCWNADEIEGELENIISLKEGYENMCEEANQEYEDNAQWKVLAEAENDLLEYKKELEEDTSLTKVHYCFTRKWLRQLKESIEN